MPTPLDKTLYEIVKREANKKFKSPSGVYRSSWIVREYKKRGGKYKGVKKSSEGLSRWFREKWVDLNSPIRSKSNGRNRSKVIGYRSCGRSRQSSHGKYPLCRPTHKITYQTPKTWKSISKRSISKAKRYKSRVRSKGRVKF
jgi:hypothetical protein